MRKLAALSCTSFLAAMTAAPAFAETGAAAAAPTEVTTSTGTEGTDVRQIIVTAERNRAASDAPSKASIMETQPESLITGKFIEQSTPESGDFTTAVLIAPSIAGISSNGGGVGDVNTSTLRGFQDGQFNVTYDGIAFGDANDTTHHPAAFFPGSTIGAASVDRGPGAAGDMGQANFGGAIHLFSPTVSDHFGLSQKATYGSFETRSFVSQVQTGAMSSLGGAKLMVSLDERASNGQQTWMSGIANNQTAKLVVPAGPSVTITAFTSFNYTRYNQTDNGAGLGAGVTTGQQAAYGINFALNNDPTDEHYYGYNNVRKHTNFSYLDIKADIAKGLTLEDQAYYYYYDNQTISAQSASDLLNPSTTVGTSYITNDNGTTFISDIAGYKKQNKYKTYGDVLRLNQDLGFGTLRIGGLWEKSSATRFIANYDLTTGAPDLNAYYGSQADQSGNPTNYQYYEPSGWTQYQLFGDFQWRPLDNLTITPGIKTLHYRRTIDATIDKYGAAFGVKTYNHTNWFITANYRIRPDWSIYAQAASAFLIPPVKTLTPAHGTTSGTAPQTTTTYQVGTVYTHGQFTFDADYYYIDANNVLVNDAKNPTCFCYINTGKGRYYGFEGQGAVNVHGGLTLFANGSINIARNTYDGTPGDPVTDYSNAPKYTAAFGAIYDDHKHWQASVSDKIVGKQLGSDGATYLGAYSTIDGSVSYDFGKVKLKLAVFNLADQRHPIDFDGTYQVYQVGRQVQGTVQIKY